MVNNWSPRFFPLAAGDILTGFTLPFWNTHLQTQEFSGATFPIRNFLQPAALVAWVKDTTNNLMQPADVQAVATNNGKYALLMQPDTLPTPSAPTAASVGVASAEEVPAKVGRTYLLLKNTSAATISIAFGAHAAVLNSGITLAAGEAYEMSKGAGNLHDLAVNGIASVAASNLAVQEA